MLARYGLAVACGWVKGPLLDSRDDGFVDAVAQTAGYLQVRDLPGGVDDDVEDHVALCAVGEGGEIGLWRGEEACQSYVNVAGAEGVCTCGGVRLRGDR